LNRLNRNWIIVAAIGVGLSVAVPYTVDFRTFYDAASRLLAGQDPYAREWFFHPIQVAVWFIPLAVLPFEAAYRLHAGLAFILYVAAMWRLLDRRWDLTFLSLLSPFAWLIAFYGNIEYLVLLGATLPPPIGLWFVLTKPQMGFVAAAVMVLEEWRAHGWQRAVLVSGPLVPVVAISIWLGFAQPGGVGQSWNVSAWPYGLIAGVPLAWLALKRHNRKVGLLASAVLSPYITALSWSGALPALMRNRRWAMVAVVLSWILFLIWRSRIR
jgi:hypothetical protein